MPENIDKRYCGHIEDALDLWILRSILVFVVSGKKDDCDPKRLWHFDEADNTLLSKSLYLKDNGVTVSALDRVRWVMTRLFEAQDNVLFSGTFGVDNVPHFRLFLSLIPNPSRISEIHENFHDEDLVYSPWFLRRSTWTNDLINPWDVDWSEYDAKAADFLLRFLVKSARRQAKGLDEFSDDAHSLRSEGCDCGEDIRFEDLPDDLQQA